MNVAVCLNSLSLMYELQGRFEEAEPLLNCSLLILQNNYGKTDPQLLTVIENLAVLYQKIGKYDKAKELEDRADHIKTIHRLK